MKKTLFLLLSFVAVVTVVNAQGTDLSTMTDAVYVQSQSVPAGSQQTLSVCMKNSISVQTIQFDLYLPEGLSFVANEDGELMTASKARTNKFNYFESSIQADGALRLLAQASTTNIPVGDGEIATVIVKVNADMELGDYPVSVKNIILVNKENETKKVDIVTTTITISEPADTRVVIDEAATALPDAATGVDVRVKRTIKAGEWSTICLPFSMTVTQVKEVFGNDVQLLDFDDYEVLDGGNSINVSFNAINSIGANHPCVIKVTEPVSEFIVDGVDVAPEEEPMINKGTKRKPRAIIGNYVAGTLIENGCLFLSGNEFWYSVGKTKIMGLRAYFNFDDLLPEFEDNYAESRMHFVINSETDGISDVSLKASTDACYDLQGRKVVDGQQKRGIYVKQGKKMVVK